jgi:cobalt-zinc-cadmium efflux system protein
LFDGGYRSLPVVRPADRRRSFGYQRFEILAAASNAIMLFVVASYILYEGYKRIVEPSEIQSPPMLAIAGVGLIVNLLAMRILSGGEEASLNVKGAYLEVWSDILGSLGVIAAASIIALTGWTWVDPIVAIAIGLWVLPRTWTLLKETTNVLLEGVPQGLDLDEIAAAILVVPGVRSLHDSTFGL